MEPTMSAIEAREDELGSYLHSFGLVLEEAQQTLRSTRASVNLSSYCSCSAIPYASLKVRRRPPFKIDLSFASHHLRSQTHN
jgi:hypothetical protein